MNMSEFEKIGPKCEELMSRETLRVLIHLGPEVTPDATNQAQRYHRKDGNVLKPEHKVTHARHWWFKRVQPCTVTCVT